MLRATSEVMAVIDGVTYRFRKGEAVEGPQRLVEALSGAGLAKEVRERKAKQDD